MLAEIHLVSATGPSMRAVSLTGLPHAKHVCTIEKHVTKNIGAAS
jgi:hypothetical protein